MRQQPLNEIPAEILWYVPEPAIVLMGCKPLMPPQVVERRKRHHAQINETWVCPVCNGRVVDVYDCVGDDDHIERPSVVICAQCDTMEDRHEYRCAKQRVEAAIIGAGQEKADAEAKDLARKAEIAEKQPVTLTEVERRRIWCGAKKIDGKYDPRGEPNNLARYGREWLRRINQIPDFDLILDSRGKVVGRRGEDQPGDADPVSPVA